MSYIRSILQEEFQRLKLLSEKYRTEIGLLPKGTVSLKKRRMRKYLYLAYREKGKIRFKYIGPEGSEKAGAVIKQTELRKQYENKLKHVKKNMAEVERMIRGGKI
jgi:hypothetical protein